MAQIRKERASSSRKKANMMAQIEAYVDAHLTEKLTLKIIAEHCGVSVSTVTQMFQKRSDITFHTFVTQRRMQMAEKLIAEDVPLEQVGKLVGYQDHSTFYRAFRQQFALSPREYRNKMERESQ